MYERIRKGLLQTSLRLVFLGRLLVSPILFLGSTGYFTYLSDRELFRSRVFSELRHIMLAACLDSTYYVEDWFMKKGRLLVHVAKKTQRIRGELNSPWKRTRAWLKRRYDQLH